MELSLNDNFVTMDDNDLELLSGGFSASSIIAGYGGIASTIAICEAIGGASICEMGVGALLACGPAGWALLSIGCVGAAASGYVMGRY